MTGTDLCLNKCKQSRSYLNHLVYKKRSLKRNACPNIQDARCLKVNVRMIGGVEQNPGHVENIVQVLCSGCDKNLKSGTQCESCGRW